VRASLQLPWLFLCGCAGQHADTGGGAAGSLTLALSWTPSAVGVDAAALRQGLDWNLGLLGALPPADGSHLAVDDTVVPWRVDLDLAAVGFDAAALAVWEAILPEVWESEELAQTGTVDVGRLLMLSLHEPWRYAAFTGACSSLSGWESARLDPAPEFYDVVVSLLAEGGRTVALPPADVPIVDVAFRMETGVVPVDDPEWTALEVEVLDLMPNGQQRFAAYDAGGAWRPESDATVVRAGTSGRCQWCHEGNLQLGTYENPSTAEAISYAEWESRIGAWQVALDAWRAGLDSSIDWEDRAAHTQGELLVREFLLPSTDRVAAELGVSAAEVTDLLGAGEADEEYPTRGEVHLRAAVDALLPFDAMPVLSDGRELSEGATLRDDDGSLGLPCAPLGE
jgi:hypothetical protein